MKAMITLKLSITLMLMSGVIYAERGTFIEKINSNHLLTADTPHNDEKDVAYFKHILSNERLYALLLSLENEVPEAAKSVEFVALFQKLDTTNRLLTHLLVELRKNNQLLSQYTLKKGVAMDG
ncbi:MAG: hypothetical protein Q8M40_03435 [Legionella sp.]|nr:hypothetical protein [Legionella sp.]